MTAWRISGKSYFVANFTPQNRKDRKKCKVLGSFICCNSLTVQFVLVGPIIVWPCISLIFSLFQTAAGELL